MDHGNGAVARQRGPFPDQHVVAGADIAVNGQLGITFNVGLAGVRAVSGDGELLTQPTKASTLNSRPGVASPMDPLITVSLYTRQSARYCMVQSPAKRQYAAGTTRLPRRGSLTPVTMSL